MTLDQKSKHGFSDVVTLHAIIAPPDDRSLVGTEIVLDGASKQDMDQAKSFFLRFCGERELEKTRYGSILGKRGNGNARVYVTGLLAAEEENFAFSYNITSLTKRMRDALNRERTNVGRTAYTDRVKEMLLEARSTVVANTLAEELGKIENGTCSDEVRWMDVAKHAVKILNAGERVIFVAPSEIMYHSDALDSARSEGIRIITVPDNIKTSISGLRDLAGNAIRDLAVYQEEWRQSFRFAFLDYKDLRSSERAVFDMWKTVASLAGGLPKSVKDIKISETMRPNFLGSDHTEGLWDPASGNIIIRRDQLRSLDIFAGTLLHEMVHAKSGYCDVTRDFENELTNMLGKIAAAKVK